jgi:D-sedoheptulose 7-phosphate isomerase
MTIWERSAKESIRLLTELFDDRDDKIRDNNIAKLGAISEIIKSILADGHKILIAGNGGSHADALHFAEELTGRFRKERDPIGALALGEATHLTCTSNDYGFEHVFARQVKALGQAGDVLIVLSTSGNSENLIKAVEAASEKGIISIGLLGKGGGALNNLVDISLVVPGETSDRIQEIHMLLLHTLVEDIENA